MLGGGIIGKGKAREHPGTNFRIKREGMGRGVSLEGVLE